MSDTTEAMAWAEAEGYTFEWQDDWGLATSHFEEYGEAYSEGEPSTCELLLMRDRWDDVVQSLGCIDDATDDYRRGCEEDLACQQWYDMGRPLLLPLELAS